MNKNIKAMAPMVLAVLVAASLTAGCAIPQHRPIIDMGNKSYSAYQQDLEECTNLSKQVDAGGQALEGAAGGAIIGALLAMAAGGRGYAGAGAKVGLLSGIVGGSARGVTEERAVLSNCLRGRGYSVLN